MVKRLGLLGGTFNPIHIGHLRCAIEAVELLALDELKLIPNARPPHRENPHVSAENRFHMVQLAVENVPKVVADGRELKRVNPSYTFDTLLSIRQELENDDQLFFIMGWDAFCGLPTWHRWQELLNHCHILILQRIGVSATLPDELKDYLQDRTIVDYSILSGAHGQIAYLPQSPLDISSTQIRQLIREGKSVQFLLTKNVIHYIDENQLYQNQ